MDIILVENILCMCVSWVIIVWSFISRMLQYDKLWDIHEVESKHKWASKKLINIVPILTLLNSFIIVHTLSRGQAIFSTVVIQTFHSLFICVCIVYCTIVSDPCCLIVLIKVYQSVCVCVCACMCVLEILVAHTKP